MPGMVILIVLVLLGVFVVLPAIVASFLRNVEAGTIRLVSWLAGGTVIYRGPGKSKEIPLLTVGTTIANLGMTEVRFPHPLFEGDTVHCSTEVLSKRESAKRPDAGIVELLHRAYNQNDKLVAECRRQAFMRRRPA